MKRILLILLPLLIGAIIYLRAQQSPAISYPGIKFHSFSRTLYIDTPKLVIGDPPGGDTGILIFTNDRHPSIMWHIGFDTPSKRGIIYYNTIVRDSLGVVATRDSAGKWSVEDCQRSMEAMNKFLADQNKRLNLLSKIVYCIDKDGNIHYWPDYKKALKEYYEFLNPKK